MTNPVDIRDVLAQQIYNQFVVANPGVEIYFENHPSPETANAIHVICEILPGDHMRAEVGRVNTPLVRAMGVVNMRVMVPQDTGKRAGQVICDSIYAILFDQQYPIAGGGHVTTYGVEMNTRGTMNGWFAMSVSCEYRAYITLNRA